MKQLKHQHPWTYAASMVIAASVVLAISLPMAQAQENCSGPNHSSRYITGMVGADQVAMHWDTGLVWSRCMVGQAWNGSSCTGTAAVRPWNEWMAAYMPQGFDGLDQWWTPIQLSVIEGTFYVPPAQPASPENRLVTGNWRMPYKDELSRLSGYCTLGIGLPTINQVVFPNSPGEKTWTGSPSTNYEGRTAWNLDFGWNYPDGGYYRWAPYPARLVRGGQPFAALSSPAAQNVATGGTQAAFPALTLAASVPAGQAWGGARVEGDGTPQLQVNGGSWLTQAIVKSGDKIAVRLTAGTAGSSRTAKLILRSGQTTGTQTNGANGGSEGTALRHTEAAFTINTAQSGTCGSANGIPVLIAPAASLCSVGTSSGVGSPAAAFTWQCMGFYDGATASCSAPRQYAVSAAASPATGGNAVLCIPSTVTYGNTTACTATPGTGYVFTGWTGDCSGTGACQLTNVTGPRSVTAQFVLKTYAISTAASPAASGSVTCTPTLVEHGKNATCTAAPAIGYRLSGWSGDCSGSTCQLASVTGPRSVTAQFTLKTYAISTAASPAAGGSVTCTSNPVTHGSDATCTATPGTGYVFTGWTGDCSGTDACLLSNVTAPHSVTAQFTLKTYAISTAASPAAGGSVTCTSNPVTHGSDATCTATPGTGYVFTGWTGDCSGTDACLLSNVTAPHSVTAQFTLKTYAITPVASPAAGGSVTCTPNPVEHGSDATCTATPHAGYRFHAWTGACASQSATCMLSNIEAAQTSTAVFAHEITVPEGPQTGQPIVVTPSLQNHWVIASASSAPISSMATAPPSTVEMPHGIVALQLVAGVAGSDTTVVLTYPEPLPAGTSYYKYGKTKAKPIDHWYKFSGAVVSGNTITLTLTDGGDGDNDLLVNGQIADPGGPALPAAQSIPTLSEWAMLLLTGLLGLMAAAAMRRGKNAG